MNASSIVVVSMAVLVVLIVAYRLRMERRQRREVERQVVDLRLRLASTLDALHATQQGNNTLQATIKTLRDEKGYSAATVASLIRELNRVNARCADLAARAKATAPPAYWWTRLDDGRVVGPFSRS